VDGGSLDVLKVGRGQQNPRGGWSAACAAARSGSSTVGRSADKAAGLPMAPPAVELPAVGPAIEPGFQRVE
jgi:hypothetical protein